jgi:hypothetical protein
VHGIIDPHAVAMRLAREEGLDGNEVLARQRLDVALRRTAAVGVERVDAYPERLAPALSVRTLEPLLERHRAEHQQEGQDADVSPHRIRAAAA